MTTTSRAKKIFALSLGQGLTGVVNLVSGMVMARVLSQAELATYRQTMLAYQIAIPLLSLGLTHGIYYFLPTEKTRVRGIVMDALFMMVAMGLLYAVFIALGGNHLLAKRFSNPTIVNTLAYLVPLPLVMLPAGLLSSVLVVQDQVNKLAIYNVSTNMVLVLGVIAACLYWQTPEAMVIAKVGTGVVMGLLGIRLMLKALPKDDWRPHWRNMKKMLSYSIPLVTASVLGTISFQLDKIIVSSMCTPEEFAIYSNGAIEIPSIGILTGLIMAVILPDLRRLASVNDGRGALVLFRQFAGRSAMVMMPVMMFLLASAKPFILTLFSFKYINSVLPFQIYLLTIPMRIVTFDTFLMAFGKTRTILNRSAVGLVANAVMSILFVHSMGYLGAIIGTILSLCFVETLWNFISISRIANCSWWNVLPLKIIAQLTGLAVLACLPVGMMVASGLEMAPFTLLLINGILFVLTFISLVWIFRFEIMKHEIVWLWAKGSNWIKLILRRNLTI
ncbi:oligosaccharide flippase family protein [Desulfococcus multivorans]|uniref:Polysaccharide biosynthesis protein n=1 Tax=Desulfococcus multivorans DSM 2059 TaxID=1121405 RepID=S7U458_DESML|nr:oligosaccharide flippase family protein [Desulfococcus multivorans]AOY59006.1 uncharacterized protein Dmul_22340 [Desulfococcus multivorans]AQV01269.1 hypothetical protein B2D07_11165 [Desulfococcus multivorans]EPR43755.1 polysaccharide biosynthesis protein [Desulfococcus multivorans DSM 2059]SJZ55254.1 Membrane protein involved in the export of O-antigen and teichoic acid [Desulfococcus multivorans DSM 2059]